MCDNLTTKQAAEFLNLKQNTLEIWRLRGCGPQYVKLGRAVRYRRADLNDFIQRNLIQSTSQAERAGA